MQHPLEAHLKQQIGSHGPMPFDRFMEAALYHPKWGYYESEATQIGRRGDFQTSVSVGPVFGELLARKFLGWMDADETCQWMECGAHHGQLAEDILRFLIEKRASDASRIIYIILEPSEKRRAIQKERLKPFGDMVVWVPNWEEAGRSFSNGVIFSNELMDAFPVKRFVWDKKSADWLEGAVTTENNAFSWTHITPESPMELTWLSKEDRKSIESILPDQYLIECTPSADLWWQQAAEVLKQGYLMTLDYGFTDLEKFSAHRTQGTLRTYDRHRLGDDFLSRVGRQDLTAHVDFPSLQKTGEMQGLQTESLISQEKFIHGCLEEALAQGFNPSPDQIRQIQTLMHPEHFGRAFKALIQKRSPNRHSTGLPDGRG